MTAQSTSRPPTNNVRPASTTVEPGYWFGWSAFLFQVGLALVTFEEVRPFGVMLSDYCFGLSILLLPKSRLLKSTGSGILLAGSIIFLGAILSLRETSRFPAGAGSLVTLFILYGLIAPLALCHSKAIYRNLYFLMGGICLNCLITVIQASVFPGIIDALSVNPPQPDVAFAGRYQGLTEFPVTLGLIAALGVLIGIGLFSIEKSILIRWALSAGMLVCSIAALLSGSRTFLGSLIPAAMVFAFLQKYRRKAVTYALVAMILLWGGVAYLVPGAVSQYSERIGTMGLVDYGRLAGAVQAALEISEKPILGWGVDHFDEGGVILIPETGEIAGAHNTFLRYWYAAGLLGAVGYLALFALPLRRMVKVLREKLSARSANVLRLAVACYLFFFIVCNLGPYFYNRYLYVPMFVLAGYASSLLAPVKARKVARASVVPLSVGDANATS